MTIWVLRGETWVRVCDKGQPKLSSQDCEAFLNYDN